jgi:hypothetical protein
MMKIIVNGREVEVEEGELSYEKIVELAGMSGNPSVTFRAKATDSHGNHWETGKAMSPGTTVNINIEMTRVVANCAHTGNA